MLEHRARAATTSGGPLRTTEGRGLLPPRGVAGEQETAVKEVIIIETWYQSLFGKYPDPNPFVSNDPAPGNQVFIHRIAMKWQCTCKIWC